MEANAFSPHIKTYLLNIDIAIVHQYRIDIKKVISKHHYLEDVTWWKWRCVCLCLFL